MKKLKLWLFTARFFKSSDCTVHRQWLKDENQRHTKNMSKTRRKTKVALCRNSTVASLDQAVPWFFFGDIFVKIFSGSHFCVSNEYASVVTAAQFIVTCIQIYVFGTVPRLKLAETTSATPKVLGASAQLCSGLIRLHGDKWQHRTQQSSVRCQNLGVPCRFFGAWICGFRGPPL